MSTKKITALTELSAAAAATDMLPVVDISDTTDAASGTTKKITATNICKGVGIGAGNTTAEPVKINTSNGRIGIGLTTPTTTFHVQGTSAGIFLSHSDGTDSAKLGQDSSGNGAAYVNNAAGNIIVQFDSNGYSYVKTKFGIGEDSPSCPLDIVDSTTNSNQALLANVDTNSTNKHGGVVLRHYTNSEEPVGLISGSSASGSSEVYIGGGLDSTKNAVTACKIYTAADTTTQTGTLRMTVDGSGNLGLGTTSFGTNATQNIAITNGTAPASSPANQVQLYAEDVSTSELKVRDEAGNVATLSPHNFELVGERSEPMAWSYAAKNVFVGKEVNVDMMKVIRALEKLTGEEYIKIKDLAKSEKLDWDKEEERKETEQKKEIDAYKKRKAGNDAHPTNSSTKTEIKAYLDKSKTEYEDAPKEELLKLVPKKQEFVEVEPTAYSKKPKPSWIS